MDNTIVTINFTGKAISGVSLEENMSDFIEIEFNAKHNTKKVIEKIYMDFWYDIFCKTIEENINSEHENTIFNYFFSLCGDDIDFENNTIIIPFSDPGGMELSSNISIHWAMKVLEKNRKQIDQYLKEYDLEIKATTPTVEDMNELSIRYFFHHNDKIYGIDKENKIIRDEHMEEIQLEDIIVNTSCECGMCKKIS